MAVDPLIPTDPSVGRAAGPPAPERAGGADFLLHLIDIVNPLQHIPIVSTIYRKITGDEIAPAAQLIGGGLFAGPIGLVAAIANIVADGATGEDFGERAVALFGGRPNEPLFANAAEPPPASPRAVPADEATTHGKAATDTGPPPPPTAGFLATMLTEGNPPAPRAHTPELTVQPGLADTILSALDKYQAMAREKSWPAAEADDYRVSSED